MTFSPILLLVLIGTMYCIGMALMLKDLRILIKDTRNKQPLTNRDSVSMLSTALVCMFPLFVVQCIYGWGVRIEAKWVSTLLVSSILTGLALYMLTRGSKRSPEYIGRRNRLWHLLTDTTTFTASNLYALFVVLERM